MTADAWLQRIWYGDSSLRWMFLPFSLVFGAIVRVRRWLYARQWLAVGHVAAPVVVIGNLTVGGTGKTPLVIWLAMRLAERGWRPGIVLRGYGGKAREWPRAITTDDDPALVGDEAVLLAASTGMLVVAGPDRLAAAHLAVQLGADLVLSDDGLQHYRLARDCELAVLDAARLLGNGHLLPAGPLREPVDRLQSVDLILLNQRGRVESPAADRALAMLVRATPPPVPFTVEPGVARSLTNGELRPLESFRGAPVHALAGIGNPLAFFAALVERGLTIARHAPGDHAVLTPADLDFGDDAPVLMTEKDAVKCRHIADARCWAVTARVAFTPGDADRVLETIETAARARRGEIRRGKDYPAVSGER